MKLLRETSVQILPLYTRKSVAGANAEQFAFKGGI